MSNPNYSSPEISATNDDYYDHPRPEVAALVPLSARRVVDVGCGAGALGRYLKATRPYIEVRGVEIVPEQAARARIVLDDIAVASATDPPPAHWPPADCLIFADVLEHLVDPWMVLRQWHRYLIRGGTVIVSLPNVSHVSVIQGLSQGQWHYADSGILDRTHLRYFTRRTGIELLEQADFQTVRLDRVLNIPDNFYFSAIVKQALSRMLSKMSSTEYRKNSFPYKMIDLFTMQFLYVSVSMTSTYDVARSS